MSVKFFHAYIVVVSHHFLDFFWKGLSCYPVVVSNRNSLSISLHLSRPHYCIDCLLESHLSPVWDIGMGLRYLWPWIWISFRAWLAANAIEPVYWHAVTSGRWLGLSQITLIVFINNIFPSALQAVSPSTWLLEQLVTWRGLSSWSNSVHKYSCELISSIGHPTRVVGPRRPFRQANTLSVRTKELKSRRRHLHDYA